MNKLLISLAFILARAICYPQTIVPGGVVSGTWTSVNSPYLVQGAIMVANGTTLNIDAGVRVEFQGSYKFLVLGQLLAIGTVNDSITFSATDTTVGWLGIRFDSTSSLNDSSKFFYCKFQYGKANGTSMIDVGGGLYFKNFSKAIISNCNFSNCFANNGGGIYCVTSNPVITSNLFFENIAAWEGAGIDCLNSEPIISKNTFINNSVTNSVGRGGGVGLYNCVNPILDSNIFISNLALRGGSIFSSGGSPTITNNNFSNNFGANASCISLEFSSAVISHNSFTNNSGGCMVFCEGAYPTISNNYISNNTGVGIYCYTNSNSIPIISNNILNENSSGGIICYGSSPIISNNFITNNNSIDGGAIYCKLNSTPIIISNNLIANNSANSLGGAIYCYGSSPLFYNNTIVNNSALIGGALYCTSSSDPTFSNTIIWGNTATNFGNQVYLYDESSDPNFSYCDVEGNSTTFGLNVNVFYLGAYNNNIDSSPSFINPSSGSGIGFNGLNANWALLANSPCIDSGDPIGTYPPTDIAGNPRVLNGRIDIGAYEDLSSGINNISALIPFEVYPNPNTGKFTLIASSAINNGLIEIYSSLGEKIYYQSFLSSKNNQINLVNISRGIYLLKVINEELIYTKKIVID